MKWLQMPDQQPCVYRGDGLAVVWQKPNEIDLYVKVWQILIGGKKPDRLPASQDDKIIVDTVVTKIAPLVKAVQNDDLNTVRALLAKGADPNVTNILEIPVLAMAIRQGSAPIVEALLKNHADPNLRDGGTDMTPLLDALSYLEPPAQIAIVKLLVAAGADVNAASRKDLDFQKGVTPLMEAAQDRNAELVQLLLEKGADVNAKTQLGLTAISVLKLDEADDKAAVEIIRMLKAAGAKE
jgi:ankyrin repeat protein